MFETQSKYGLISDNGKLLNCISYEIDSGFTYHLVENNQGKVWSTSEIGEAFMLLIKSGDQNNASYNFPYNPYIGMCKVIEMKLEVITCQ